MHRHGLMLVAVIAIAGCASNGGASTDSGIFGVAMMGPTCPVERDPPDPACADRPYQGSLVATSVDGGSGATFSTDPLGQFNVSLPAGEYEIRSPAQPPLPACSAAGSIIVVAGHWTRAEVACDTGIR